MAKVLLIEDDEYLASLVRDLLAMSKHTVEHLANGADADNHLRIFPYDLIILDIELPGKNGLDILREYRGHGGRTPILMLTSKATISDRLTGLDTGADDYLPKPFDMRELDARVRALLRRPVAVLANVLKAADLELDPNQVTVTKSGEPVRLLPQEFKLLEFLMRHPNQVFSMQAILNHVWPSDSSSTEEALRSTTKRLRKKIDPEGKILCTVHGVGYVLRV
jgi:DNA-binding response OmpR family regulator